MNDLQVFDPNQADISEVANDALLLGKKYLKVAEGATNTKSASLALSVAERAFALASKVGKDSREASEVSNHAFITQIDTEVNRSQLWLLYLDYCEDNGVLPLSKSQFFLKLAQYEFQTKKTNGVNWIIPPGYNKRMKKII